MTPLEDALQSQLGLARISIFLFAAIQSQQSHNATQRPSQFEGSSKCSPQMRPSFTSFWRMHCYCYPSRPLISQYSLRALKRRKKQRKWQHHVVQIVTFSGLASRNRDERVKHLVTQPGSAPKTRPSHLTTADAVNKVSPKDSPSKAMKAGSFEGRRPRSETQHLFVSVQLTWFYLGNETMFYLV